MTDPATAARLSPCAPDEKTVTVCAGGRVLVVGDLRLGPTPTPSSAAAADELARTLDAWGGPGALVLAGNSFELLGGANAEPTKCLGAHARLQRSLALFAALPGHTVLLLPGIRDGRLAWDERMIAAVGKVGATVALSAVLEVGTGKGCRRVRVEPGQRFDALDAPTDPRNPADSPLGVHLAREILPHLAESGSTWLDGADDLADPVTFPAFIASRLAYRRLSRYAWLLLLPFAVTLVLRLPLSYFATDGTGRHNWATRSVWVGGVFVVESLLLLAAAQIVGRRVWRIVSGIGIGQRGLSRNDGARIEAKALIAKGWSGLITGHTRHPELAVIGDGFYANVGCCGDVVDEVPGRFGLPPVFLLHRELSWLDLEAGAELHVRLVHGRLDLPGSSRTERLVAKSPPLALSRPVVVAEFPPGPSWPPDPDPGPMLRRRRRFAAAAIGVAAVFDLVSAVVPTSRARIEDVTQFVPFAVPQTARALVALVGLALLVLARGVRRGQAHAWTLAMSLLLGSALLHLIKGVDIVEAFVAIGLAILLFVWRGAFQARFDRVSSIRSVLTAMVGAAIVVVAGAVTIQVFPGRPARLSIPSALLGVAERMVGIDSVTIPHRLDRVFEYPLPAIGVALILYAMLALIRPVVGRRGPDVEALDKARAIVRRHGGDTLAYFALRDDKQFFFHGDSVVAFAILNSVCLVSPDPIGPATERDEVWGAFRRFVDEQGWTLAVMGAGASWLPTYRAAGMSDLYVGDEAVADAQRFSLDGGQMKGLRQAVNRIAKYGYTCRFFDPAHLEPALEAKLRRVLTTSRKGEVERGFSMTLGRVFDPNDEGLLLAVAFAPVPEGAPEGTEPEPVAFCQYVPAADIDGYSLDLMRRDSGEHPNGITDFLVIETIRHLKEEGRRGLGLNFATMRAVLAGELGNSLSQRMQRWFLQRMGDSMQIESLWKFNAKFEPDWRPRYAVYDGPEHMLPAAIAVARAESFWELPVIGRFFVPDRDEADAAAPPAPWDPPPPA